VFESKDSFQYYKHIVTIDQIQEEL